MRPRWEKIEAEEEFSYLTSEYLDYDEDADTVKELAEKYEVSLERLPIFIFFDDNEEKVDSLSGEPSEEKIREKIREIHTKDYPNTE